MAERFQLGRVEELLTILASRLGADPLAEGAGGTATGSTAVPAPEPDAGGTARKRRSKVTSDTVCGY